MHPAQRNGRHSALDVGGSYNNLTPFYGLATTNFKFYQVPVGGGGNLRYVWKPNKDGILKVSLNTSYTSSGIAIPNPSASDTQHTSVPNPFLGLPDTINFVTKDQYYYSNVSYKQMFKDKFSLYTAASYSLDQTNNTFDTLHINEQDHRAQFRIEGKDFVTNRFSVMVGAEVQSYGITKKVGDTLNQAFTETQVAGYTELEWQPINAISIRPGLRYERSELLNTDDLAPRLAMAIKTGKHTQVSLAGGMFYQDADNNYLLYGYRPGLQEATHYIANWQYSANDRTLRIEGYYKKYNHLTLEKDTAFDPNPYRFVYSEPTNSGYGYAQGLELFWRDKKSVKNLDYWVSYSYIDTKRLYENFPVEATPAFVSTHNLNLVGKYFVDKWHTNFSMTYSYASGRPYYNPEAANALSSGFMTDRTIPYNNLAIAVAYLHSFGKWFSVFYVSIDNITNNHNIFGYRYIYDAAATGGYDKYPIVPALYRTVFVGANFSLTQFKKDEL